MDQRIVIYFVSPEEKSSSLFSQTIMVATSITFAMTLNYVWYFRLILTLGAFLVTSYFKLLAGSIFPSDVIYTLIPLSFNLLVLFLEEFYQLFDINRDTQSNRKEKIISGIIICSVMVLVSRPFKLIVKTPFWLCIMFPLIIQKDFLIDELNMNTQMTWYVIMVELMNLYIAKGVGETLIGRRMGGF